MPDGPERMPWHRLSHETTVAYGAFRRFRDLGPGRSLAGVPDCTIGVARKWSKRHHWAARSTAWDDELARLADLDRLDQLRSMHANHARASRALQAVALQALAVLDADTITASDVARLFELGARLERLTLSQSVEELQHRPRYPDPADPWTAIANELTNALPGLA